MRVDGLRVWAGAMALLVVLGLGRGSATAIAQEKKADEGSAFKFKLDDDAKKDVVKKDAPAEDPFAVPEGSNQELLKYVEKLQQLQPPPGDQEATQAFIKKLLGAMLKAADKVLAAKPTEKEAETACNIKLGALSMMDRLGDKDAGAKIEALPAELEKLGLASLAAKVKSMLLQRNLMQAAQGNKPEEFKRLLEEFKKDVAGRKVGPRDVNMLVNVCLAAERMDPKIAVATYADFGKILAASDIKSVAGLGAKLAGAGKRIDLVGKEFQVEGVTVDGKPLDWGRFKDKVVLVNFWATWCGPCLKEIPELLKAYDGYHKKGFDVVAVSVDHEREKLDEFLQENKFPWAIVVDQAAVKDKDGLDKSMGTRWGVLAIPELILVGKDGKVVARGTGGLDLAKELTALLGPAEPTAKDPAAKDPAAKDPAAKPAAKVDLSRD
jgi:thiol-disulfide isomerase/thioredoxin